MAQNLSTFSKQLCSMLFVYVCWQTPVFPTGLQMQINSLPAGGDAWAGDIAVSPVMAVIKSALRSEALLYQALQERQNENDIKAFLKTASSFQRYIRIILKWAVLRFSFNFI